MGGIYIHIPFCRQVCSYCDFYFVTRQNLISPFVNTLLKEIELRQKFLPLADAPSVETIYFGGGTPSLLSIAQTEIILNQIYKYYAVSDSPEITMELNPDDVNAEYISSLKKSGVNRFSLGVQSFRNEDLKLMHRAHDTKQAENAIKIIQDAGAKNFSIDLIYGAPALSNTDWLANICKTIEFSIPHLSCYCLTVEERTSLHKWIQNRRVENISEEKSAEQFLMLMNEMEKVNYIHYEISNFCKEGFESIHNSNYWKGKPYLGFGPSAHSFDGKKRSWNKRDVKYYISSLEKNILPIEDGETLTVEQQLNERILTSIRTRAGIDLTSIKKEFFVDLQTERKKVIEEMGRQRLIAVENSFLILTRQGKLFADHVTEELSFYKTI